MATETAKGIHFEAEGLVNASAGTVWDILTDYRNGHPRILPPAFSDFVVESGGKGAGTVMRFTFHGAGTTRHFHQVVSEPEAGRVLVETDLNGPAHTTFTLTPLDDGRQTRVHIATDQTTDPGIAGALARLLTPLVTPTMRRIYQDELQRLDTLAQRWPNAAITPAT
jgi:hypothetical protein